jgi:thiol-disulfide isomerase/thioredoxin
MLTTIESKLDNAKLTAKMFFDTEWCNACKVAEHLIYLQKKYNTNFVFAFNNKMYVIAKGGNIRIGSAAMSYDLTTKQIADDFDYIADNYFKDYFKSNSLNGLKYYPAESESIVDAKESSWLDDFGF